MPMTNPSARNPAASSRTMRIALHAVRARSLPRAPEEAGMAHNVYLAETADGSYYCGYALDPARRIQAHNARKGAKILRGKLPVKLTFVRRFASKSAALKFERALKRASHAEKTTLAARWLQNRLA